MEQLGMDPTTFSHTNKLHSKEDGSCVDKKSQNIYVSDVFNLDYLFNLDSYNLTKYNIFDFL